MLQVNFPNCKLLSWVSAEGTPGGWRVHVFLSVSRKFWAFGFKAYSWHLFLWVLNKVLGTWLSTHPSPRLSCKRGGALRVLLRGRWWNWGWGWGGVLGWKKELYPRCGKSSRDLRKGCGKEFHGQKGPKKAITVLIGWVDVFAGLSELDNIHFIPKWKALEK